MSKCTVVLLCLLLPASDLCVSAQEQVQAVTPIPPEAIVAEDAVHSLHVEFFDYTHRVPKGLDSMREASNYAGRTPTARAVCKIASIDFPPGPKRSMDTRTLTAAQFLLGEDSAKRSDLPERFAGGSLNLRSVFRLKGFVDVPREGTFTINAPADDGLQIRDSRGNDSRG